MGQQAELVPETLQGRAGAIRHVPHRGLPTWIDTVRARVNHKKSSSPRSEWERNCDATRRLPF
jgi:hypothetical protein